jgi:DNA-directed RNA polymerase subunit RPC12/RpoP
MFRKYFENTRHYTCPKCGKDFSHNFWQWLFTIVHDDITRHRLVKCPHCRTRHWIKANEVK